MRRSVPDPFLNSNVHFIPDVRNNTKRNNNQKRLNALTHHARLLLYHLCYLCFHCVRAVVELFRGRCCQGVVCESLSVGRPRGSQFQSPAPRELCCHSEHFHCHTKIVKSHYSSCC